VLVHASLIIFVVATGNIFKFKTDMMVVFKRKNRMQILQHI